MTGKSRVAIGSLGGTVSMTADAGTGGVVPRLSAAQLAASVPGLAGMADIHAETLFQLPSASLGFDNLLACLDWAQQQVDQGAAGIVLTQGTDTLEESAFFLDLFWDRPAPLVLTGAMRHPQLAGADGPANLLAAVTVAAAAASRARGALVVMNDVIHEARWVTKGHALAVNAFASPVIGPAGTVVEGQAVYFRAAARTVLPRPGRTGHRVALVESCLGEDDCLLRAVAQSGCQGLVIAAFGAGHVSFAMAEAVGELAGQMPVIIASRTGAGTTAARTYGYVGAEMDLAQRGALLAGWLQPRKARLLLWALLADGRSLAACRAAFMEWGHPAGA